MLLFVLEQWYLEIKGAAHLFTHLLANSINKLTLKIYSIKNS